MSFIGRKYGILGGEGIGNRKTGSKESATCRGEAVSMPYKIE